MGATPAPHSLILTSLKMEACPACRAALNREWLSLSLECVSNSVEMGSDPLQWSVTMEIYWIVMGAVKSVK